VGGIGSGKSWAGSYDLVKRAKAGRLYMVLAPTYAMLSDATFRSFLSVADDLGIIDPSEVKRSAPPSIRLRTGAEVLFRSADDPDRLRGPNLSGVWMDEASLMPLEAFSVSIGRLREAGEQGWLTATFTPKGRQNWTYDTFATGRPDTAIFHARTSDNPFLPPNFYDTVAQQYTSHQRKQELDAEFVDAEGQLFKVAWFRATRWTRVGGYYQLGDRNVNVRECRRFATVDHACSTRTAADYTVVAVWDDDKKGALILAHLERDKVEGPDLPKMLLDVYHTYRPAFFGIECIGAQLSVIQSLRRAGLPIREMRTAKDKQTHSLAAQVKTEAGQIWLPQQAPWLADFEDELFHFPNAAHDDQVDCLSYAAEEMLHLQGSVSTIRPLSVPGMQPVMPQRFGGRGGFQL
jgi:predicted phage terminase large subunit-like protein